MQGKFKEWKFPFLGGLKNLIADIGKAGDYRHFLDVPLLIPLYSDSVLRREASGMSTENRKRKAIASFTFRCEGVSTTETPPLLERGRAGVSLTVYEDGLREIGCAYLNKENHECMAEAKEATRRCVHLYPVRARSVIMEQNIRTACGRNIDSDWSKFRPNSHN